MREAYWLAFALALTPFFMQLVYTVLIIVGFSRIYRRNKAEPTVKRSLPSGWFPLLLGAFAFALALEQGVLINDLFADYSYDYGVESVQKFGVSIPLALGERVNRGIGSAFSLLFNLGFAAYFVWLIAASFTNARKQPGTKAGAVGWIFGVIILGSFAMAFYYSWLALPNQIENIRALF